MGPTPPFPPISIKGYYLKEASQWWRGWNNHGTHCREKESGSHTVHCSTLGHHATLQGLCISWVLPSWSGWDHLRFWVISGGFSWPLHLSLWQGAVARLRLGTVVNSGYNPMQLSSSNAATRQPWAKGANVPLPIGGLHDSLPTSGCSDCPLGMAVLVLEIWTGLVLQSYKASKNSGTGYCSCNRPYSNAHNMLPMAILELLP